jgi:heat shock protein HslJ
LLRPLPLFLAALALSACAKAVKQARAQTPLATLAGSEWGPEGAPDSRQFIAFKSAGEVMGHGGCNRFFGSYELEGKALRFGPLASTRMACADMKSEHAFMSALQSARAIDATHLRLTLLGENGEVILTLRRRDWD